MTQKQDIKELADVKLLVDTFYDSVRKDELLSPIFEGRIKERWPEHLDIMYKFWQTVLLEDHTYFRSPFPPHMHLQVDHSHFVRWLQLFNDTVGKLFEGERANEALWRAAKMAEVFEYKLEQIRTLKTRPIL